MVDWAANTPLLPCRVGSTERSIERREFPVGSLLQIIPNHACVVSNLFDAVIAHRGDTIEGPIPVAARGRVL